MDDIYKLEKTFVDAVKHGILPNIKQLEWRSILIRRRLSSEASNRGFSLDNIDIIKDIFKGDSLINALFRDNVHLTLFIALYEILHKALDDLKLLPGDGERYYHIIRSRYFDNDTASMDNAKQEVHVQNHNTYKKIEQKAIYQYAVAVQFNIDEFAETERRKKVLNIKNIDHMQEPCCNQ